MQSVPDSKTTTLTPAHHPGCKRPNAPILYPRPQAIALTHRHVYQTNNRQNRTSNVQIPANREPDKFDQTAASVKADQSSRMPSDCHELKEPVFAPHQRPEAFDSAAAPYPLQLWLIRQRRLPSSHHPSEAATNGPGSVTTMRTAATDRCQAPNVKNVFSFLNE